LCSLSEAATTIEPDLVPRCSIKLFRKNAPIERIIKPSENAMKQCSTPLFNLEKQTRPHSCTASSLSDVLGPAKFHSSVDQEAGDILYDWERREAMNSSSERARMIVVLMMSRNLGRQDQVVWKA
jgi:hypothetical protein